MRVRGEDLLADLDRHLLEIVRWVGVPVNAATIEEMKHPENSPFACFGPLGAHLGNDPHFLEHPQLHTPKAKCHSLEGALSWRENRAGFSSNVKQLAKAFGYH